MLTSPSVRMDNYHLVCEEFSQNSANSFRSQFENEDFADVSLACSDEMTIKAHRIVLSTMGVYSAIIREGGGGGNF